MSTMRRSPRVTQYTSPIRAITFDVGGTLIACSPSVGHIYAQIAARHGCTRIAPAVLNRQFAAAWCKLTDFRHTRAQWAALVDATFGDLVQPPPSQSFLPALYDRFAEADAWRVYKDVLPALKALKAQGLKLGVISNWDERLRPLLHKLDLAHFFDSITVSCDLGAPKPSPDVFLEAARRLGLAPAEILHVGDSMEADVRGARAAGFHSVLLKRGSARAIAGTIQSLSSLLQVTDTSR
jgi:putative hydrolase of the HAD superfamily